MVPILLITIPLLLLHKYQGACNAHQSMGQPWESFTSTLSLVLARQMLETEEISLLYCHSLATATAKSAITLHPGRSQKIYTNINDFNGTKRWGGGEEWDEEHW